MEEIHPFVSFIPKNARYLILGSFPGKEVFTNPESYDFFYGTKRNQFWPILEGVYKVNLKTKEDKIGLLTELGIAITDSILSTVRTKNSNLDVNLTKIKFNYKTIENIMTENKIEKIFFTSRFVETIYKRHFKVFIKKYPEVELFTLPSPSPRYAVMSKTEKIKKYKELLPILSN